jgi:hypothetical protein
MPSYGALLLPPPVLTQDGDHLFVLVPCAEVERLRALHQDEVARLQGHHSKAVGGVWRNKGPLASSASSKHWHD